VADVVDFVCSLIQWGWGGGVLYGDFILGNV